MAAVTIKDVARMANTSISTVSKVMNGSTSISEETVLRVKKVVRKLDYKPNIRARGFALQTSSTIVFITPLEKNLAFVNPYIFELICGLEEILSQNNYSLVIKSLLPKDVCSYVKSTVNAKMADGIIINGPLLSKELDALLTQQLISHIAIGAPVFTNRLSWIDVDNRLAGKLASEHLLANGYKKIGFIGKKDDDKISMDRYHGVTDIIEEETIILPDDDIVRTGLQINESEYGYAATKSLLESSNRPDALICSNNYCTFGCIDAIREKKLKIGRDIGIIAFDDFPFTPILDPPITSIVIDMFDLGIQAGKQIIQKIQEPKLNIQAFITLPVVIERNSTQHKFKAAV